MKNTAYVRIHKRHILLKGEACDGTGGIWANPRELLQCCNILWKYSFMFCENALGYLLEVDRAAVVAKPRPRLDDHCGGCGCEHLKRGEGVQEGGIPIYHARHLRLLEHHLCHQHVVGGAGLSPGEIPSVAAEPLYQIALGCGTLLTRHRARAVLRR
jgi:hypothetical protein